MIIRIRPITVITALLFAVSSVFAGRYPATGTQTFTFANGTTTFADTPASTLTSSFTGQVSKVTNNTLQLATAIWSGGTGSWRIADLDAGAAIESFDGTFTVGMNKSSGTTQPGSGWALCFGPIPAGGTGSGDIGFAMAGGIVLSFDTYANTANDHPSIDVICNNTLVGSFLASNLAAQPINSGTFTLTNPVTGGTSGALQYNASASTVQSTMRLVSGWSTVVVTGTAPNWTVNRGVVGSYADPTGNGANLVGNTMTPGQGRVVVTNTQDGTAALNEIWTISLQGRGFVFDATQRAVSVHWDYSGLDLTYAGQTIFTDLPTPGFVPAIGQKFAFTASAAGGAQDTYFDDVVLSTTQAGQFNTGGPIISEFMAENNSGLEDEDVETPDWIEIYNGQNAAVNLAGYQLTNGVTTWTFPSVTVAAYGHLVVYASAKNRTANTALLHTNFTLPKTGGTVSLRNPSNIVVSTYTYPNQIEDYSYGLKYQGNTVGFLGTASPGTATSYSFDVAPNGPAEDVIFSREGGIITGATTISITAPLAPGSEVRYTTDNTFPSSASTLYTAPLSYSTSTNLRARVYTPGYLPGKVSSRTFLHIDTTLSNYNGSGQPFQSHLPLIVLDSFGVNVDSVTDQAQPRPHRYTYSVVIDKAVGGFASITSPTVDFQGRSGTHVRGDSSGGFAQKSYAWETWDNNNDDKAAAILGMPAESDWALHGPFTDKTFFRNFIIYAKLRELRGGQNGFGMRVKLVEVIYNQDPGQSVSYNDYRGVYVLMERIKVDKNRVDIAKLNSLATDPALITGGYIFRRDRTSADGNTTLPVGMHSHTPNILNSAQTTWLSNHINAFNNALNGANFADPVLGYAPYIDVTSFIDNWLFVEIAKQIDGYRLSTYFYKDRGVGSKIVAAPIWDFNLSLGNADYLFGDIPTGWYWNQTDSYWWARLRQDPNYELKLWDRYWHLRRGLFATNSIIPYIDSLASTALNGSATPVTNNMSLGAGQPSTLENATQRHYRKYQVLGTYLWPNAGGIGATPTVDPRPWQINTTYQLEVDWMKNWLTQRLTWFDDQNFVGTVIYRPPNFSHYGGNVASGTQLTITQFTGTPPGGYTYANGAIRYTTDGSDPRAAATGTETNLIPPTGATVKWLIPSAANGGDTLTAAAGANQWTNYTDPPNNANWSTGLAGVGYDTGEGNYTTHIGAGSNVVAMQGVNATCYARITFTIPDQATLNGIGSLRLGMKYDDGFRAYINGTVVAGRNDTDPSMSTPWNALTTATRDEAAAVLFEEIDITNDGLPALRVGTNVLAVHCLNGANASSSDLLMSPKLSYLPPGAGSGGILYTGPITLTNSGTINARVLSGTTWSPMTTAQFVVNAAPASAANLVVSEIMYNPTAATTGIGSEQAAGYGDNDFEYLELLNVGGGNVDLSNVQLTTAITYNFNSADPEDRTLTPGQRIVVAANRDAFTMRYGALPGVKVVGPFGGSLSNQGETLNVLDAASGIIATVTWGTAEPWPVQPVGGGYSIVLNNPTSGSLYTAGNWRHSAQLGGTPGSAAGTAFSGNPNGDTDSDGFSDYLEYALGNSHTTPGTGNRPTVAVQNHTVALVTSPYLTFSYRRNNAADGVNYTVQLSGNLTTWASDAPAITYVGTTVNPDGTSTVVWRATNPFNPATPQYMRLRVAP